MKKLYFILFFFVLIFSISGCNYKFTVEFVDYDGSIIETINTNDINSVIKPVISRKGYTFMEWNTTEDNNKTIYQAVYQPNTYIISFGDNLIDPISVVYDSEVSTLPIPLKEDNFFVGWKYNDGIINIPFTFNYDDNIILEAIWSDEIKVDYIDYDGSIIKSLVVDNIEKAECDEPLREGYNFVGWEKIVTSTKIEFKAKYNPNTYTISFDTDGGSLKDDIHIDYYCQVSSFSVPIKENYNFLGWLYNDELISFPFLYNYKENITLKASWSIKEKTLVEYVDYDGKLILSIETYKPEETSCDAPSRNGYDFVMWEKSFLENKIEFKAVYKAKKYNIMFDSDGGNTVYNVTVDYEKNISNLPTPVKENYDFLGWMYNNELITYPYKYSFTENVTLKAKWNLREKILIEYVDYDDVLLKSMEVYYLEKAYCDTPIRRGHSFLNWEKNTLENKVIYKANYTVNSYKITFVSNSLQGFSFANIKYNQTITVLPTPTKDNYIFMGWFLNDKKIELPYLYDIDQDIILSARWEKSIYPSVTADEYNSYLLKIDEWFNNANQFHVSDVVNTKISINHHLIGKVETNYNETIYSKVDFVNDYYESKVSRTGSNHYYEIYRKVEDIIYHDVLNYSNGMYILNSQVYNDTLDFSNKEYYLNNELIEINSYRKIEDNHYLAYTTLGSIAGDDINLDELANELGISKEYLKLAVIEIETIYSENSKQFGISLELSQFSYKIDDVLYTLDINIGSIYNHYNEEIIPFDYEQDNVILPVPTSIEEITETTDLSQPIKAYEAANPHYYRVYLEAGQYSCNVTGIIINDITMYNRNQEYFDLGPLWDAFLVSKYQFIITEADTYYIKVLNNSVDLYTISFTKLNYETISDPNNPQILSPHNTLSFDGEYDFQYFYVEAISDGVLIIDSIYNNIAVCYKGISQKYKKGYFSNDKYIIPLNKGYNSIIINSYANNSVTFNTEIIYDNIDTTKDINNMPTISNTFSDEYYLVGYSCKNDYLKIVITEGGYYKIEFEHYKTILNPNVKLFCENGASLYYSNRILLNEGVYYIEISQTPEFLSIVKVKYTITQ